MTAHAHRSVAGPAPGWPETIQACDRCLALSQLTVALAKVPRLRLTPPTMRGDDGRDVPVPLAAPLVPTAAGLEPTPGSLCRAVDEVLPQRARALAEQYRGWEADRARAAAADAGLEAYCACSARFPDALRVLTDPPPVVYVRGDRRVLASCPDEAVGMVGTRHPTLTGRDAARRIAGGIARCGGLVVSGMALGIDAASHEGALTSGGLTVAVLAGGADRATPSSNRRLYGQIVERGAAISEMPPGIQPFRWSFPARNRLIAALSVVTLVVEAPLRSGALITAEHTFDLGRDVFAVPGSLASDVSEGTNKLLVEGAHPVLEGAAVAAHIGLARTPGLAGPRDGPLAAVHEALARGPLSPAELVPQVESSLPPEEVDLALLDLELAGWIARRPDGRYRVVDRWEP